MARAPHIVAVSARQPGTTWHRIVNDERWLPWRLCPDGRFEFHLAGYSRCCGHGRCGVLAPSFTLVMQEFVYALTFITAVSHYTVSVGVPTFLVRGDVYFCGSLMAACFIASMPIAILDNFFVDRFISGFTVGAIQ